MYLYRYSVSKQLFKNFWNTEIKLSNFWFASEELQNVNKPKTAIVS
jgi:hypothetical protein